MILTRLEKLQALLKDDPTSSFILFAIAKEYEGLGQLETAIATYLDLLEKEADYVGAYYHLAKAYEETEELDNALAIYQKGMEVAQKAKDQHAYAELQNARMNLELEM